MKISSFDFWCASFITNELMAINVGADEIESKAKWLETEQVRNNALSLLQYFIDICEIYHRSRRTPA